MIKTEQTSVHDFREKGMVRIMKIQIGENIKRLRRDRNITQEALAEILGVSCAAVSKWERGDTYPDITLIFPLADFFGVSVDDLLGYNRARAEAEIGEIFRKHHALFRANKTEEMICLMRKAKKDYPNNYHIMVQYMWDIGGGFADNDPEVLLAHKEELSAICERVLDGCTDFRLRLGVLNMKAKLLHAEGKTEEALAVYRDNFSDWYNTEEQKIEQLFAKDTPEFRDQLVCNIIELSSFAANKKLKELWYCKGLSIDEKAEAGIKLGGALSEIRKKYGYTELCFAESNVFGDHVWKMTIFGAKFSDIAVGLDALFAASARCDTFVASDKAVKRRYTASDGITREFLKDRVKFYTETNFPGHAALRDNPECAAVLTRWRGKL